MDCRGGGDSEADRAYRALYAHLTVPATKTVEVWRLNYASRPYITDKMWHPQSHQYRTEDEANRAAANLTGWAYDCIRVTGPHKQEVPA